MRIPSKVSLAICPAEKCYKFYDYSENKVATYPCDIQYMDLNFFTKLEESLKGLFENTYLGKVSAINFIIPDDYYSLTSIMLPKLNKQLSMANIKTELQARFMNINDLNFEFFLISQKQDSNLYLIKYMRKEVLSQFHKVFSSLKKDLADLKPRSLAMMKNLYSYEPKLKQRTFIVLDILKDATYVSIVSNMQLLQYHNYNFGTNILSNTNVIKEESLHDHKLAQLAVVRAKAAAKAKKAIPDEVVTADDEDLFAETTLTDEFEIVMKNWDNFMKLIFEILDNEFFYKNDIKFDDIIFNLPKEYHYVVDNSSLESEVDATGMEVKRKKKVVNTLERKQPYVKKPTLRKRNVATFTKQDKKAIQLRAFDIPDMLIAKK